MVASVVMSDTRSVKACTASAVRLEHNKCKLSIPQHELSIGDIRLRVEYDTASTFRDCHAQVDVESNSCYTNSGIVLVLTRQICIIMLVTMRMRMSHVRPCMSQADRRILAHIVRGTQCRWFSNVVYDMRPLNWRAKGRIPSAA